MEVGEIRGGHFEARALRKPGRIIPDLQYDRMTSLLAPYGNAEALAVARGLDDKIEKLMRDAAG